MGLCHLYSMITIVRKKKVNPRIMGERGGVPASIFCIYNFAFWGSYFWILQYTVTVDTSRGHSRQAFPQGRMKGTIEMTWYWIIQNVNVNSWES